MPALRTITLLLTAAALARPAAGQETTLIRDARVFDGRTVTQRTDVLVRDGVIAAVGPRLDAPADAEVVDATGMTLLPGLIDSHTHVFGAALRQALVFGVTTELDMFMDPALMRTLYEEQQNREVHDRADVFSAGALATAPGGHGTQFGVAIPTLGSADEADAWVEGRLAEGSSWIKIVYDDGQHFGIDWPTIDRATLEALIEAAHARDRLAVVHVSTADAAEAAIASGADGLVHLFTDSLPDDRLVEAMRRRGAFAVPTLLVEHSIAGTSAGTELLEDERLLPYMDPMSRGLLGTAFPFAGAEHRHYDVAQETTRRLHGAGVPILAGSDAPNPGTAHGAGLHRELELLVEAGLTPAEALEAATAVPARVFGLEDRGRIAPGLRADLLLVRGDPTVDIERTRAIEGVWKGGRRLDREAYRAEVESAVAQAAAPPSRIEPGLVATFDDGVPEARFGTPFTATSDRYVGGGSEAEIDVVPDTAGGASLRVHGTITGTIDAPWAGAMWGPVAQSMSPADLSTANGIAFRARGDGSMHRVQVFSRALNFQPVEVPFRATEEWSDVTIAWSEFGIDGSDVSALLFVAGAEPGPFSFLIDDVRLE